MGWDSVLPNFQSIVPNAPRILVPKLQSTRLCAHKNDFELLGMCMMQAPARQALMVYRVQPAVMGPPFGIACANCAPILVALHSETQESLKQASTARSGLPWHEVLCPAYMGVRCGPHISCKLSADSPAKMGLEW